MAIRSKAPNKGGPEHRFAFLTGVEARSDGETVGFTGHASVFNKRTWIGPAKWGFWEVVEPGAFSKTIKESDVRMLFNHDENFPLARSTVTEGPGSLRLSQDDAGLVDEADWIPTSYARDIAIAIQHKIVTQQSISFDAIEDAWTTDEKTGEETRRLIEARLYDVSPVTFPAFSDTDAALRSVGASILMDALDLDGERRSALLVALRSGNVDPRLTPALRAARTALDALVEPLGPTQDVTPAQPDPLQSRMDAMRRSMDILRQEIEEV